MVSRGWSLALNPFVSARLSMGLAVIMGWMCLSVTAFLRTFVTFAGIMPHAAKVEK